MGLALLHSRALTGIEARSVSVETHCQRPAGLQYRGLAETEVRESRERVRAAILNSGFEFPNRRITVNRPGRPAQGVRPLRPADRPWASRRQRATAAQWPDGLEFAGELSLSGELRPVRGALAMAMGLARDNRRAQRGAAPRAFVVAAGNGPEAALIAGLAVLPAPTLLAVCAHLRPGGGERLVPAMPLALPAQPAVRADWPKCAAVQARRALEVAAAGQHPRCWSARRARASRCWRSASPRCCHR